MTDSSDMDIFDSITSGEGSSPEPKVIEQQEPTPVQTPAQSRDDSGRFAKVEPAPAAAEEPAQPHQQNGAIPPAAIKAEREKRQETQQENELLRRQIDELRGQMQILATQRQPQPAPQQQEPQPATLWDDPDAYLKNQLTPVQQQMQEMREMLWESQASNVHGAEKLQAAKAAAQAIAGTPEARLLHQQITANGNPFDNLVKWHQQRETLARIGNDPDAFIAAEIERRMNDPAFLSQAMERARSAAASNPSNRSQPLTNFAPTLSRLPSGGNAPVDADQSDAAVFSSVTSGRRK